jgi:hypothetical protein
MLSKQKSFFAISNTDGTGTPSNFTINFNNNNVTNQQGANIQNLKRYIRPISMSIDLSYYNVSTALKNNKISIQSNGINSSPVVVTIPDGSYNGISLQTAVILALNNASITWTSGSAIDFTGTTFNGGSTFTFGYSTAKPAGITTQNALIKVNFVVGDVDSRKVFGNVEASLDITYASNASGTIISRATTNGVMDLVPINSLFVRSNIAKSFYKMANGVLSSTDILFIIDIGSNIGGTQLQDFPNDNLYYQEINSANLSNLNIRITDKENKLVEFLPTAEVNFVFAIENELIQPNLEQINKNNIDNLRYN